MKVCFQPLARRVAAMALAFTGWAGAQSPAAAQAVQVPSLDRSQGTAVVLPGHWFAAPGKAAAPAMVLMHGCGGNQDNKGRLAARYTELAARLNAMGVHVLVTDSFTPRGEKQICTQKTGQRRITQLNRRRDALGALQWMAAQPGVDATRLGLLGWSNGGSTVLAATDGAHPQVLAQAKDVAPFKTAIAFYPGCTDTLTSGYALNTSLTLFLGADDDWTLPGPCIAMAKALESQGKQTVELNVYPGAVHDFDTPLPGLRERADVPSRLRPGRCVMTGQNPAAREASWARVRELLAGAFR